VMDLYFCPSAYSQVCHLHPLSFEGALSEWEMNSLAALRARALHEDALELGEFDAAAAHYSLLVVDRASARRARERFLGASGGR